MLREQHAAAVVLAGGAEPTKAYTRRMTGYARALDAAGSRLVLVGRPALPSGAPAAVVEYDNPGGAFQATALLPAAGHRRVLFLSDALINTAVQRREGFLDALRAHGVPFEEELEVAGVFAGTDMVAIGAIAALLDAGLRVPDDIPIVGFDDVSSAGDLTPALTTVHVPYEELGRVAVRLALERREHLSNDDHIVLGTQLMVRRSTRTLLDS